MVTRRAPEAGRQHAPELAAMVEEVGAVGRRVEAMSAALTPVEGAETTVSDLHAIENLLNSARRRLENLARDLR